jgi:hypothetical protein
MKKTQPKPKTPRKKKASSTKKPPAITSKDARECGKLYAALALAAEFAAEHSEGEKKALFLQAMRFAATLLRDLEKLHKGASKGLGDALAILNTKEAVVSPETTEAVYEQA